MKLICSIITPIGGELFGPVRGIDDRTQPDVARDMMAAKGFSGDDLNVRRATACSAATARPPHWLTP